MAVAFRSESHATISGTTTIPSEPSGAVINDVFVALFLRKFDSPYSIPSGWTNLYSRNISGGFLDCDVSYIVRGSSAPSLTWTTNDGQASQVVVLAFSGVNVLTPIDASADNGTGDESSSAPDAPSATAVATTDMAIALGAHGSGSSGWTAPTGYTLAGDATSSVIGAYKLLSVSGAENPAAFGGTPGGDNGRYAATVLLKANIIVKQQYRSEAVRRASYY